MTHLRLHSNVDSNSMLSPIYPISPSSISSSQIKSSLKLPTLASTPRTKINSHHASINSLEKFPKLQRKYSDAVDIFPQ